MNNPELLWRITLQWPPTAQPCWLEDALLIATANGASATLHALDVDSHLARWQRAFENVSISGMEADPVSDTRRVLLSLSSTDLLHGEGAVVAFDPKGDTLWRWSSGGLKVSMPAVAGDLIYITLDAKALVALDLKTGLERQRFDLNVPASLAAPLIVDDTAYIPCRGPHLLALGVDGLRRWQYTLDRDAWLDRTPVVIDQLMFVVSSQGEALALNRHDGMVNWRVTVGTDGKALSAPATDGQRVFVGAYNGVYTLNPQDGRVLWPFHTERRIEATPLVVDEIVYAAGHDHRIYALEASTGRELWRYEVGRRIELPPLMAPDRTALFVVDHGGTLTTIARPLTLDELISAGRWLDAAAIYAADGQILQQAGALTQHARLLVADERAQAEVWASAAALFDREGEIDRARECRHEAARCRHQPILSLAVQHDGLVKDKWSRLRFSARNEGHGPARNVIIHAEGDQFAGQVMVTRQIVSLDVGRARTDQLDVRPLAFGDVPLRVHVDYVDSAGEAQTMSETIYLSVARDEQTRGESKTINLWQTRTPGEVDLVAGVVAICNASGEIEGTGFVVTDRLILTCAHVVEAAGGGPGETINVRFHLNGARQSALVVSKYWHAPDEDDIAVLRLAENLPVGVKPIALGKLIGSDKHPFRSLGYPNVGDYVGIAASGIIEAVTQKADGRRMLQLTSSQLAQGHSGAPVWDEEQQCVVGMVSEVYHAGKDSKNLFTAFATPAETLRQVCVELVQES